MIFINKRRKVAYDKQIVLLLRSSSHKDKHILIRRNIVDPLKTDRIKILRIQCRLLPVQFQQRFHIIVQLLMFFILQKIPLQALCLAPLCKLCKILAHEQKLLARMREHKSIRCAQVCEFHLSFARHLSDHGSLSVYHFIVRQCQNKFLTVRVNHTERQLSVMIRTEDRIQLHIAKKIIHPAHVPLIVKTKSVFLYRRCDLRPCGRLLCDQQSAVFILFENRIQMFKKLYCLQILVAAVNICNPLAVILSVVQIQHRSHCIHPDSICMVYVFPEQCICDQKI